MILDFGCVDVGFWMFGRWILVGWTLDFGLCGHWIFVIWTLHFGWADVKILFVWTLDYGCVDVGFWLYGRWILIGWMFFVV